MGRIKARLLVAGAVLGGLFVAGAVVAQSGDAAPEARYVMDVGTIAGMMGQGDSHELNLRLGSRLAPTGAPKADHFMPAGARLGASVPLTTPAPSGKPTPDTERYPSQMQRPKGRLLIYWGCGAHVGAGQPVIIDFAKVAQGQFPPNLFSTRVTTEVGPMPGNSRTYGDWPHGRNDQRVTAQSSLIGQHRIAGTYSPEIAFALNQDFMASMKVRSAPGADGTIGLSWNAPASATGYYAWAMGGKAMSQGGSSDAGADMVWWTSSATQDFGGGLWDWLPPATVARLVGQKVVMPASQTSCQIPAEVKTAAGPMMMGFLYAYGPEANFAFPERPKDPKIAWRPKWTAKVRYRSMANFMTGMPSMADMLSGRGNREETNQGEQAQPPKACKPKIGGFLKKAIVGGNAC